LGKNQRTQVVKARNMIHVFVRQNDRIKAGMICSEHLLPKIRAAVNEHLSRRRGDKDGRSKASVFGVE
jgi:hypothetical protein